MADEPITEPSPPQNPVEADGPTDVSQISLPDLLNDLSSGAKDINQINIYHAIIILSHTLHYIIKLREHPDLYLQFRLQQLKKLGIDEDELKIIETKNQKQAPFKIDTSSPIDRSSTPPLSPPLKFAKLNNRSFEDDRDSTEDEKFFDDNTTPKGSESDLTKHLDEDNPQNYESFYADNIDDITYNLDHGDDEDRIQLASYIPVQSLVEETDLDVVPSPITDINLENIKSQVLNSSRKRSQNQHLLKIFNLVKVPPLSIEQFLLRIKQYSPSISVSSYIHSAFVMFKLTVLLDLVPLTMHNVYRFIVASIRCATKNIEDIYQKQKVFATVVGVSLKDLFRLEVGFLYLCDFKVIIGELMLNNFLSHEFYDLCEFTQQANIDTT
ncbi:uncharacterized protein SPAPADRAFT_62062 [Spathaspora passalidarum NRRL Y-27907]|uniref:Cyclin n=1 Tax=Spathaspora passalidarum (strain NRRL Y-27907 / 11-Y1) TaxID=619300 RepID=G3AQE5_SPAPN|nr:uncharacterized protein SPAPADRAFT_62062 [Spathaspora passalidarum NRRL Y-27907]EGW31492.1 hypothetical protein SPAPADRAFT_62062 [Spathaspora passalidarum NRRL Y-27907]